MTAPEHSSAEGYDPLYAAFDSPLMRQLRQEAYGEDIGQHSWVTAEELRSDVGRLSLTTSSRLLDAGCGPCGPLVFAVKSTGCMGTGLDVSASAVASGRARASAAGVQDCVALFEADLNLPVPFDGSSFDAVISLDVIVHLRNRKSFFHEMARLLAPTGRFLLTDAGVITGPISNEEVERRSINGYTQFVPSGLNENLLEAAGFRLIDQEDRTHSVLLNASGRLRAMLAHRAEIEGSDGKEAFARQQRYVETVVALAERRALSRIMYCAELAKV
ncbi:class I SAM-dependent methyltransferase [Paraburkholderia panacisoli]|uniref:Class I SAM-dependent methyltransferase n=1 Tax=Paraburkholderia panacisoli TaxID=2603818 RepID=A0A5B0G2D4_9BURK|nr:class I SAM-dependent methyltransferase [Paraburkholderia panacisoli]KAA0997392.1 class I SAM-dependent methyltransferase [Paraburkholderia panacisoli]